MNRGITSFLVLTGLFCGGCAGGGGAAKTYDFSKSNELVGKRPEMQASAKSMGSVLIDVVTSQDKVVPTKWAYMDLTESASGHAAVKQATAAAFVSKGIESAPIASTGKRVTISTKRFEAIYTDDEKVRDVFLEGMIAVTLEGKELYSRKFDVRAERKFARTSSLIGWVSPLGGSLIRDGEDKEWNRSLFVEVLSKYQDLLAKDPELVNSLMK